MGNLFDVHAAFGGYDHGNAAGSAVDQHRQIVFAGNVDTVGHIEAVDLLAGITRLYGYQRIAEHFLGIGFHVFDALRQAYAAFRIGTQFGELALAAAAGVNLCLHDVKRSGQLLRTLHGLFDRQRGMPCRDADAVFREQFLGLVFVDVHGGASSFASCVGESELRGP